MLNFSTKIPSILKSFFKKSIFKELSGLYIVNVFSFNLKESKTFAIRIKFSLRYWVSVTLTNELSVPTL